MSLYYGAIAIWVGTLLLAAWGDFRTFRIPNTYPLILLLLFPAVHAISGFSTALLPNLMHFGLALVVGMILFGVKWIGGGDAKLYAAVALWFDWSGALALLLFTTIAGLIIAILFVGARIVRIRRAAQAGAEQGDTKVERRIAYGLPIALGAILAADYTGWAKLFPLG